jgi:hypothetical protein
MAMPHSAGRRAETAALKRLLQEQQETFEREPVTRAHKENAARILAAFDHYQYCAA